MKDGFKVFGGVVVGLFVILLVGVGIKFFALGWEKFWAPKEQSIKRQVFEETKSYVHGKIQDLSRYYEQYQKGDSKEKEAIKSVIRMQFSDFDATKINNYKLRRFLETVRGY